MKTYLYRCARCVVRGVAPKCQNPECGQHVPLRPPTEDGMSPGYGGQMSAIPAQDRIAIKALLRRMDALPYCQPWPKAADACCEFDPPIALYGSCWTGNYSPHDKPERYRGYRIRAEVCCEAPHRT